MTLERFMMRCLLILLGLLLSNAVMALEFHLAPDQDLVGKLSFTQVQKQSDWYAPIGRQYDIGFNALQAANPGINSDGPGQDMVLILPTQFLLPNVKRNGIVINVPEMRLYYFPHDQSDMVYTFPIGVGRQDWNTPVGELHIVEKIKNPIWIVPDSIMKFREAHGDPVPKIVRPGPNDPLGDFAMRLSDTRYLIHGTNEPDGIGMRSSAGCIRMYPEDIASLFAMVPVNTPVNIINEPFKTGWADGKLYLSVMPPLAESTQTPAQNFLQLISVVKKASYGKDVQVDWQTVNRIFKEQLGIPQVISR